MADVETTNPEDDVLGNVGGVVGDPLKVARSQDELQANFWLGDGYSLFIRM